LAVHVIARIPLGELVEGLAEYVLSDGKGATAMVLATTSTRSLVMTAEHPPPPLASDLGDAHGWSAETRLHPPSLSRCFVREGVREVVPISLMRCGESHSDSQARGCGSGRGGVGGVAAHWQRERAAR
jgi:hypothetical protein